MYTIQKTNRFLRDYKRLCKRNYNIEKLRIALELLQANGELPEVYLDHPLKGRYQGFRECHIEPDWLLVYDRNRARQVITLARTGSHSDLFD